MKIHIVRPKDTIVAKAAKVVKEIEEKVKAELVDENPIDEKKAISDNVIETEDVFEEE